jgi:hypothetical protein
VTRKRMLGGSVAVAAVLVLLAAGQGAAAPRGLTPVPAPNSKVSGVTTANRWSPELAPRIVAQGSMPVENPTDGAAYYGYLADGPLLPAFAGDDPLAEATKTEPDKNTYLVLRGQAGPDSGYFYGSHFLFQGHEGGGSGYITRVNLDADPPHRVTVLATRTRDGVPLRTIDGSTWNPFTGRLLLTAENGCDGAVYEGSPAYTGRGSTYTDLAGLVGRGGFEGVQVDGDGNIWFVEDVGGAKAGDNGHAKLPNSYVYRFRPYAKRNLSMGGVLEALQVMSLRTGQPVTASADPFGADVADLDIVGNRFSTRWVVVHDTRTQGAATAFCATAAARTAAATPFKRPENGQFRPGTSFREFFFTATGDTSIDSPANGSHGGWGGVFRLVQASPSAAVGRLSLVIKGDQRHTGLDNLAFWDKNRLAVVEDAGDGLHTARNALDSGYVFDVSRPGLGGVRFVAEGRDPSATVDSALGEAATPGFQNEGDNELTGLHVSNGAASVPGLLGAVIPSPGRAGWRVFLTQQHGDNVTYEITSG